MSVFVFYLERRGTPWTTDTTRLSNRGISSIAGIEPARNSAFCDKRAGHLMKKTEPPGEARAR